MQETTLNKVSEFKIQDQFNNIAVSSHTEPESKGKIINIDFVFCAYGPCLCRLILVLILVVQQSSGSFPCAQFSASVSAGYT